MQYKDVSYKYLFPRGGRHTPKDILCTLHDVKIGSKVKVRVHTVSAKMDKDTTIRTVRAVVQDVYENYVVLRTQFGYNRCMNWDDFHQARVDKDKYKQA